MTAQRGGEPTPLSETVSRLRQRLPEHIGGRTWDDLPPVPTGWTEDDARELRERQAANRRAWYERHLPVGFRDASLDRVLDDQDPDGHARGWLDSTSPTLWLVGRVGVGKSFAAYAVCNEASQRGLLVVAVRVPTLLAAMRPNGDAQIVWRAEAAELLLIDDLGAERPTEWTVDVLGELVDLRVREQRRQIVTSNLTYAQVEERLGERTASRLTGGGATVVQMRGGDRRRQTWG